LVGVCLWQLLIPAAVAEVTKYVLSFGTAAVVLVTFASLFRTPLGAATTSRALPGAWEDRAVRK
jgi:NADH-quinone oxidoreductase subunit H